VPTVPVGFSAARIATIELRPIIKFRDYILPILRKTLSLAVQMNRQPITTFGLPALDLPAQGFSAPYPPAGLARGDPASNSSSYREQHTL
jgi:hypothetical protein